MDKKFLEVKNEYDKLTKDLMDPEFVNDQNKVKVASQKLTQISDVVKKIEELEKVEKESAQAQAMLSDETDEEMLTVAQEEVAGLAELKEKLEQEIKEELIPKDPNDNKDIIIEIRAGTGGDEAALFATDLYKMYTRYAENQGWKTNILSSNQNEIGGFKEVIFGVQGDKVYKNLKYESGTHRVQRVPDTEKSGRVHTSAATVAVLPEAEEVDIEIKPEDLRVDVFRSGGNGGQSVNTTDSAVRMTHIPTGVVVSCQDEKSQIKNKQKALKILRSRIYAAEQERIAKERSEARNSQIGTGDRSEKIRTYNFPQDRISDHRIKKNWNQIEVILNGEMQPIIDALMQADQ